MSINPPFRAEHVGSLLRPPALKDTFAKRAKGEISDAVYEATLTEAISHAVKMQEGVGLHSITDGEFGRDFVYVKDAVDMTLHFYEPLADASGSDRAGGLFNVGSGRMNTWNALADAIFGAMDMPRSVEYVDMPEHLRDRYQYNTQADLTRIRETGYTAETTELKDAVADYIRNYLIPGKHLGDSV